MTNVVHKSLVEVGTYGRAGAQLQTWGLLEEEPAGWDLVYSLKHKEAETKKEEKT